MNNKQSTFLKILVGYWDIREWAFKDILFQFEFFDGGRFSISRRNISDLESNRSDPPSKVYRSIGIKSLFSDCPLVFESISDRRLVVNFRVCLHGGRYPR